MTSGFFSNPFVYDCFQSFWGAYAFRKRILERFVCLQADQRLLDVGCGTGKMSVFLPDVDYVGVDSNPNYISHAMRRYRKRTFCVGDLSTIDFSQWGEFDTVLAFGVYHHLDDKKVQIVCKKAQAALRQGGRLVTVDPLITSNQSFLEKLLIHCDRGRHIRTESEYRQLVEPFFSHIRIHIERDFPTFQYTHIVMIASNEHHHVEDVA